jgi:chaperone LolA
MRILCLLVCLSWLPVSAMAADDAGDIIKRVQKAYKQAKDFTIDFSHETKWPLTGMTDKSDGTMQIRGDQYRFQSGEATTITDGKTIWFYSTITRQLLIDYYDPESDEFLPREMMFKFPKNYHTRLLSPEVYEGRTCDVIQMTPKKDDTLVQNLKVWVDREEWTMRRFEFVNIDENREIYQLHTIQRNTGLSGDLFQINDPPDGAEVQDLREP